MNLLPSLLVSLLFCAHSTIGQSLAIGQSTEMDGCYAYCTAPINYQYDGAYLEYTGTDANQKGVELVEYELEPETTKWVKKRADKNCLSANPDDCLVWCMATVPGKVESYYIVVDTVLIKDFKVLEIDNQFLDMDKFKVKRAVLCDYHEDYKNIVKELQLALIERGYFSGRVKKKMTDKAMRSLREYQSDNRLAIGQLDLETLEALGVAY